MEIKRSSWHYRWLDFMDIGPWRAKTLCQYLGMHLRALLIVLLGTLFGLAALGVVAFFSAVLVVNPLIYLLADSSYSPMWADRTDLEASWAIAKIVWPSVALCVSVVATRRLIYRLIDWVFERRSEADKPSLLRRAWQDFKEKTCTRITYKD